MPHHTRPYRTEPLQASDESLDRENSLRHDAGKPLHATAEESCERILRSRISEPPTDAAMESWVLHPDERVPLCLVTERSLLIADKPRLRYLLFQRALATAEVNDERWNPLLDALAWKVYLWPDTEQKQDAESVYGFVPVVTLPEVLEHLVSWIHDCDDPRDLLPLLSFRSTAVTHAVASSAKGLDGGLLEAILKTPHGAASVATNSSMTTDQAERVAHWACRFLLECEKPFHASWVRDALVNLLRTGHEWPAGTAEHLLEAYPHMHVNVQEYITETFAFGHPETLEQASVRRVLERTDSVHVLRLLCPHAPSTERSALLERMFSMDPAIAIVEADLLDGWDHVQWSARELEEAARELARRAENDAQARAALKVLRGRGIYPPSLPSAAGRPCDDTLSDDSY